MAEELHRDFAAWEPLARRLFEQAPGFLAILDGSEHRFRFVNASYRRLVGNRELIGRSVAEAFPELANSAFFELLDQAFSSGEPRSGERRLLRLANAAGGAHEDRYVDFIYQPMLGPDARSTGLFVQGHDVTAMVVAEQRSEAQAAQMALERQIFDTALSFSDDFNYVFDTDGRFTYVNRALLALWGMDLSAAIGKTFFELPYDPELAARLHAEIASVVQTGQQVRNETYYRAPDGKDGWFEYIFNPVRDAEGKVVLVAGSTRDLSARVAEERRTAELMNSERAARAEAERLGRVKDEFLATLSHELRTPLNSIMGWAQLLRSGRLGVDKAREGVDRIIHNGRAQGQLIADLLDVNAIASAKLRLQIQRLPLNRPLEAALDSVRPDAEEKGVALLPPEHAPDVLVDCDPDRMQQVFWNLLANAVKFTPAGGTVAVAVNVDTEARQVRVGIADSGCGIEAEFLPHVFKRFTQADGSPTRRYGGLGLGLSICKTLVGMHGGEIQVHSDGAGQGSTFLVGLPSAGGPGDPGSTAWGDTTSMGLPSEDEATVLRGMRVLLVDDDAEGRSFVLRLLEEYGAVVTESESADEALRALAISNFGLMICDIGMPGRDGYTLMREVRASPQPALKFIHAIALTAFARGDDEHAALESGFDAWLAKPAEPARIVRTCLRVIDGRASHLLRAR